jgi:hypothetical protein
MYKKEISKKELEKDSLNKKMKLLRIVIVNNGFKKKKYI